MHLPYYLECVCKTAGEYAGVENRTKASYNILDMGSLENEHEQHAHCTGNKELQTGKLDTISPGGIVPYCQNMERECQCAKNYIEVSPLKLKTLSHAQQIKSAYCQKNCNPHRGPYPLPYKKSQTWNQHNIERSYEPSLARSCILYSHLLQIGCKTQKKTACYSTNYKHPII